MIPAMDRWMMRATFLKTNKQYQYIRVIHLQLFPTSFRSILSIKLDLLLKPTIFRSLFAIFCSFLTKFIMYESHNYAWLTCLHNSHTLQSILPSLRSIRSIKLELLIKNPFFGHFFVFFDLISYSWVVTKLISLYTKNILLIVSSKSDEPNSRYIGNSEFWDILAQLPRPNFPFLPFFSRTRFFPDILSKSPKILFSGHFRPKSLNLGRTIIFPKTQALIHMKNQKKT